MKIDKTGAERIESMAAGKAQQARSEKDRVEGNAPERAHLTDQAALSERAYLLSKAHASLNSSSDTRTDLVASLRSKIRSGEYEIPYRKLAEILAKYLKL